MVDKSTDMYDVRMLKPSPANEKARENVPCPLVGSFLLHVMENWCAGIPLHSTS